MSQPAHTRLLNASARTFLWPLGLRQSGRSRLWFDDHGWWLVVIEFQPSSWSKGSYLNVGAMWLWFEKDYFSFDDGYRVEAFVPFEDEAQFAIAADALVKRAADEVSHLRSLFPSVNAAAQHLTAKSPRSFWDSFHAAVACGLAGNILESRRLFEEVAATNAQQDWAQATVALARDYRARLDDVPGFRLHVQETVLRTRGLLRIEDVAETRFDEDGRNGLRPQ